MLYYRCKYPTSITTIIYHPVIGSFDPNSYDSALLLVDLCALCFDLRLVSLSCVGRCRAQQV